MDFLEAEQILSDYGEILANPKYEHAYIIKELKNTKAEIILAFKIWYIREVKFQTLSEHEFALHNYGVNALGLFCTDDEAQLLQQYGVAMLNDERTAFIENHPGVSKLVSNSIRNKDGFKLQEEVMKFVDSIKELDKNDPLYFQRAYTLANTEYRTEYKETFDNPQAAYNKRLQKTYRFNDREILTSRKIKQVPNEKNDLTQKDETNNVKRITNNEYTEMKWIFPALILLIALLVFYYYAG